jgi:hypothetical protein
MNEQPFDANILKNLQAVKFGKDGSLEVPVRADGTSGIVIGTDAVERSGTATRDEDASSNRRGLWKRLLRR